MTSKQNKRQYQFSWNCSLSFCLWIKATVSLKWDNSTISAFQHPDLSHLIFHYAKFQLHWCNNDISINRAHAVLSSVNDTKKTKKKAHTFNCTGLQLCLKVTFHKYAQVQDSQCIAHLWQNWVLAVKTNGHGNHEVPNYLRLFLYIYYIYKTKKV